MKLIYLALMLSWLYVVNLAAGALLAKRIPVFGLAKATVVALVLLTAFFIEHFVGLGSLRLAYPTLFVLAVVVLIWQRQHVLRWAWQDHAFLIGFAWALIWRYFKPDIDTGTEHITDMFFIANYAKGQTLPPPNLWLPPFVFDCYYAFQHYAAALLARIFSVGPGFAYNLAFALVFGYAAGVVWETTHYHTRSRPYAYAVLVAVLVGATGVIPFIELLRTPEFNDWPIIASMRFIGSAELRTTVAPFFAGEGREVMSYPIESFGYTLMIGDYHPPVSALLVLMVYASAMLLWLRESNKGIYVFIMGLCVPLSLLTNAWIFPLIVLTSAGWLLYCWRSKQAIAWGALIGSGALGFFLAYPFLSYFAVNSLGTPIKYVPSAMRSPLLLIVLQHWPVMLMVGLLAWQKKYRHFAWYVMGAYVALMLVSELLYVKDGMGGENLRINTGMKWMAWIYLFGFLLAAWLAYEIENKVVRGLLYAAMLIPTAAQLYYIGPHFKAFYMAGQHRGDWEGTAWLTREAGMKDMLQYLKDAPDGVVLERLEADNFTPGGAMSSFALKPVFVGWPMHLLTWGIDWGMLVKRRDEMKAFYQGEMADPVAWLEKNNIRYVLWSNRETDVQALERLKPQLQQRYYWKQFNDRPDAPVGMWVHKISPQKDTTR